MGKALADPLLWVLAIAVLVQAFLLLDGRHLSRRSRCALVLGIATTTGLWLLSTHAVESYLLVRLGSVHPVPPGQDVARIDVVVVLSGGFVEAPDPAYDQPDAWTTARVRQGVRTFFESDARLLVVSGRWVLAGSGARATSTKASLDDVPRDDVPGADVPGDNVPRDDVARADVPRDHRSGDDGFPGVAPGDDMARDDPARLALAMKQLAVELGVPEDRIVVEPNARNTREHPIELLRLRVVEPDDTIGVVTSSWHLPRAMREFEKVFPDVVAVPAFDVAVDQKTGILRWMPRSRHLASSATALAEYIGMLWYRLPFSR